MENIEKPYGFPDTMWVFEKSMSRPCLSLAISLADARSQLLDVCLGRLDLSADFAAISCHDTAGSTEINLSLDGKKMSAS